MTDLVVRRLLVDMEQPIARHWCGNDAFRTAFFNALSMSFPVGEQFFIDSVREGFRALPESTQAHYREEVQGFIGQEATHRRLHSLYNKHLEKQGLVNGWEERTRKRLALLQGVDVRHWLAVTAANEHFTSIMADWMLAHPEWLGREDARLATLWLWHSAEESEHRSTAFDLYKAHGGDETWRLRWFRRITLIFLSDTLKQTVHNLRQDDTLWKLSTWKSAASFFFGSKGLVRKTFKAWRDYFRHDFHPRDHDDRRSREWLEANRSSYTPVGA